jgi:hypothetical protein
MIITATPKETEAVKAIQFLGKQNIDEVSNFLNSHNISTSPSIDDSIIYPYYEDEKFPSDIIRINDWVVVKANHSYEIMSDIKFKHFYAIQ